MIAIEQEHIENIPTLVIHPNESRKEQLPVVIYFHGFTSAKEQNLAQAYMLANEGFRVLLPDSYHHGDRRETEDVNKIQFDFWKIVSQNLEDLLRMKTWLEQQQLLHKGRIGIAGTSMGGITVSAALTKFEWVRSAGIMMGTTKLVEMAQYLLKGIESQGIEIPLTENEISEQLKGLESIDLSNQLDRLNNRPLFVWHGEADQVVPFEHSKTFAEQMKNSYPENEFKFISEPNRDHKVSREAMLLLRDWFKRHL
ncbi:esterase [Halalkalibacillus sediminis]|uniref:Esterase n=1 Tax=Halalkalibacillus sediminis TaxID=2018042 RepID=A0A2I0QVF5_9BACI|nr:esterase [Halalkalibacillus sediminis]PKR78331.1 esterase [Halalkalibacillus sediminis]